MLSSKFVSPIGSTLLPLSLRTSCVNVLLEYLSKAPGRNGGHRMKFHNDGSDFFNPFGYCGTVVDRGSKRMYDIRKYGHCLPACNAQPAFPVLNDIPTDVFRCTTGETLGPQGQAGKCCMYRNPEYFSYHHMSFYDIHMSLRKYRNCAPVTNRKP